MTTDELAEEEERQLDIVRKCLEAFEEELNAGAKADPTYSWPCTAGMTSIVYTILKAAEVL